MSIGTLAKNLMKKTIAFSGDAAKEVQIDILGDVTYDPSDGSYTDDGSTVSMGRALFCMITEDEMMRARLERSTRKVVIDALTYNANVSEPPESHDKLSIDGKVWLVEKVVTGSMDHAYTFYVGAA